MGSLLPKTSVQAECHYCCGGRKGSPMKRVASLVALGTALSLGSVAIAAQPAMAASGHEFHATLYVNGQSAVKFTEGLTGLPSCSSLAKSGLQGNRRSTVWSVPTTSNGNYLLVNVKPYRGPGTYTRKSVLGGVGIEVDTIKGGAYTLGPGSTESVKVNPNGSGIASFNHFHPMDFGSATISGSETWTCA
jgi:hypothetical protein